MARILYAIGGQGRGHTSRVLAVTEELRGRGHEVTFACGGQSRTFLSTMGEVPLPVPALRQILDGNRLRLTRTALLNAATVLRAPRIVRRLAHTIEALAPDLVVSDFEVFVPRAAARAGLPVVSFNHQEILTETDFPLPEGLRASASFVEAVVRAIAPPVAAHRIVASLTPLPLRHPDRTTLVGPVLRRAVRAAVPHRGDHLVAYFNVERRVGPFLRALERAGVPVHLYGTRRTGQHGNLTFRPLSVEGFLDDLASCRGVVTTAGFTLLSESLFLGKPVLALPNGSVFEQTFNARVLESIGAGMAVHDRPLEAADVGAFLDRFGAGLPPLETPLLPPGHADAVDVLERVLERVLAGDAQNVPAAPARAAHTLSGLVPAAFTFARRRAA